METERIFNVIYSNVSEDLKNAVLDTALYEMGEEQSFSMLTESYADGLPEMLTDYVDLVAHRAVSEEDLDEAIESVLNLVDTDTINIVAESFMDREVRRALFEREETINELFGFGKSEDRKKAEGVLKASKASLAKTRAENAGELKGIAAMKKRTSNPIGLSGIRQHQAAQNAEDNINKQISAKANEVAGAKKALNDIKAKERREAIDKVKGAAKSVWNKFKGAVKSGVEAAKNKATEVKDNTVNAVKAGAEKVKTGVETAKAKVSDAAKSVVAKGAGAVANAATKVADKANEVKASAEGSKSNVSNKANTVKLTKKQLRANIKQAEENKKFFGDDPKYKKQVQHQQANIDAWKKQLGEQLGTEKASALVEFTKLLANSTISEEAFDEIIEKCNLGYDENSINKAIKRSEGNENEDLNKMNSFVEQGKPIPAALETKALTDQDRTSKLKKFREVYKQRKNS